MGQEGHATYYILHATCNKLHTTCYGLHATSYMLHATCNILHATCYVLHATRYMQHTTYYTLHATCYMLHATYYMRHPTGYRLRTTLPSAWPYHAAFGYMRVILSQSHGFNFSGGCCSRTPGGYGGGSRDGNLFRGWDANSHRAMARPGQILTSHVAAAVGLHCVVNLTISALWHIPCDGASFPQPHPTLTLPHTASPAQSQAPPQLGTTPHIHRPHHPNPPQHPNTPHHTSPARWEQPQPERALLRWLLPPPTFLLSLKPDAE